MSRKVMTGNEGVRDAVDSALIYALVFRAGIKSQAVSVTDTATKLPSVPLSKRMSVIVFNNGSVPVYIGLSDVSVSTGFPIYPRSSIHLSMEEELDIYGIVSTGSADVRVLEGA